MFGKTNSTRVGELGWAKGLLASAAVMALSTGLLTTVASADEPPAPAADAPAPSADVPAPGTSAAPGVEKVVVTATRRETNLQKTPVAVTAVSGKALAAAKVENIQDLASVVPSLMITNNGNPFAYTARIRGVGTQGDNPGLEGAVGTFVDGVYRNRPGVAFGDLGELDRVEVLRGPQGTLFGRNTSAGILNVLTKKPTFNNEIFGEVSAGNFDNFEGRAGFNAVLSEDQLATRFYLVRHEREGYIDVNPGRPDFYDGNATSYWSGRGQLLWQATSAIDLRIIGDYSKREDQCCSAVTVSAGGNNLNPLVGPIVAAPATTIINSPAITTPGLIGKLATNQVDNLVAFGNRPTDSNTEDEGVSAELNWKFDGGKLTSITSGRRWNLDYGQDADFSGADIIYFPVDGSNKDRFKTFTHETRINGELGWVNYLLGVFYSNETINRNFELRAGADEEQFLSLHRTGQLTTNANGLRGLLNSNFGLPLATQVYTNNVGINGDNDQYEQTAKSFAVFTHNVFHLTDALDFTAGLRWTTEKKDLTASYQTLGAAGCSQVEGALGLDPVTLAPAPAKGLVSLACLPFARHALDKFTVAAPLRQSRDEHEFSGIATLAYQLTDDLATYATYSRGHKAGGFNLDRVFRDAAGSIVSGAPGSQTVRNPDNSFAPELVDDYEVGAKFNNSDNSFIVNTAVFYEDFRDFQLNTFTGTQFVVTSVPRVLSKGVEVETAWTPFRGLSTNLGAQYTDARYAEHLNAAFLANNPQLFALPGGTLTHSPKWTLTGGVDYGFPFVDVLTAKFHVDARWQSKMNTGSNLDPRKEQDAYATVGMKFGVYSEDESFGLEFWARNLFDEHYINTAFDSPLQGDAFSATSAGTSNIDAFVGEPRMLGATLRLRN